MSEIYHLEGKTKKGIRGTFCMFSLVYNDTGAWESFGLPNIRLGEERIRGFSCIPIKN